MPIWQDTLINDGRLWHKYCRQVCELEQWICWCATQRRRRRRRRRWFVSYQCYQWLWGVAGEEAVQGQQSKLVWRLCEEPQDNHHPPPHPTPRHQVRWSWKIRTVFHVHIKIGTDQEHLGNLQGPPQLHHHGWLQALQGRRHRPWDFLWEYNLWYCLRKKLDFLGNIPKWPNTLLPFW